MRHQPGRWRSSLTAICLCACSAAVTAERLPFRAFGLEQGLPSDTVTCIVPDRRGLVWLCTPEGLVRFDGVEFRTYSTADGLPHREVTAFLQAADGTYWVGTGDGVAHTVARSSANVNATGPLFVALPAVNRGTTLPEPAVSSRAFKFEEAPVYVLHQDADGVLWCGTGSGLYRIDNAGGSWTLVPVDVGLPPPVVVYALLTDREGRLWFGTKGGVHRRSRDGQVVHFGDEGFRNPGINHTIVRSLLEDRDGRIWIGMEHSGLRLLAVDATPGPGAVARSWADETDVAGDRAASIVQRDDGSIWWAGVRGLKAMRKGRAPDWADATVQTFDQTSGMTRAALATISEDQWGQLWLGGQATGLMTLARDGFVTYTEADGLASRWVRAITLAVDGAIVVVTGTDRDPWHHNRLNGRRFEAVRFNMPHDDWGWGWSQLAFEDPSRAWWVPTGNAIFRSPPALPFASLAGAPFRRYSGPTRHNWAIFRLFRDSHGSIWAGTMDRVAGLDTRNELTRWTPDTDRFELFPNDDDDFVPMVFAEDATGDVWIGGYDGGLRRISPGSHRLEDFSRLAPSGQVRALLVDARDRLWVGTSDGGIVRIDTPGGQPTPAGRFGITQGLSSESVWSLVDDRVGRIYVGHARGVDVIDPDRGVVRSFTSADGLAAGVVWAAQRDRTGALWFGTVAGLSRFEPRPPAEPEPPRMTITSMSVAGRRLPLLDGGQSTLEAFDVPSQSPHVEFTFAALGMPGSFGLRYQVMLEGSVNAWSPPSAQRSITYGNLRPGSYRFLARAVSATGEVRSVVAAPFTVLRPTWQQWWFVLSAFALVGSIGAWLYRLRVGHLLDLERVRTRIASDLHDDVGASLSRMAILSEVAQRRAPLEQPSAAMDFLSTVADTSRSLVEDMSDIVWAVDPRHDDLGSLFERIALFGAGILGARDIDWNTTIPEDVTTVRIDPETRRHLLLLLKEAVNNIVKHSRCTRASLVVSTTLGELHITVEDDGCGFRVPEAGQAPTRTSGGNGLSGMQARAREIGASLIVESGPVGTRLTLRVPVRREGDAGWRLWFSRRPRPSGSAPWRGHRS